MYKTDKPLDISKLEQGQSNELQQLTQGLQGQCKKDLSGNTLWTQEFTACGKPGKAQT
jgi:hypothetical protein